MMEEIEEAQETNLLSLLQLLEAGEQFSETWQGLAEARKAGLVEVDGRALTRRGETLLRSLEKKYGITPPSKVNWFYFQYFC